MKPSVLYFSALASVLDLCLHAGQRGGSSNR